jgi:hypothetical protein
VVASLSLVDPLNGDEVMREHVRHEAGHAVGAVLLGFDPSPRPARPCVGT